MMNFKIVYKGEAFFLSSNNHRNAAKSFVKKNKLNFIVSTQDIARVQVGVDDVVWEEHHIFSDMRDVNHTFTIIELNQGV